MDATPLCNSLSRHQRTIMVDLDSGDTVHWVRIEGIVQELYDVVVLPGVTCPKALGFKTPEIRHQIWFEANSRPTAWIGKDRG